MDTALNKGVNMDGTTNMNVFESAGPGQQGQTPQVDGNGTGGQDGYGRTNTKKKNTNGRGRGRSARSGPYGAGNGNGRGENARYYMQRQGQRKVGPRTDLKADPGLTLTQSTISLQMVTYLRHKASGLVSASRSKNKEEGGWVPFELVQDFVREQSGLSSITEEDLSVIVAGSKDGFMTRRFELWREPKEAGAPSEFYIRACRECFGDRNRSRPNIEFWEELRGTIKAKAKKRAEQQMKMDAVPDASAPMNSRNSRADDRQGGNSNAVTHGGDTASPSNSINSTSNQDDDSDVSSRDSSDINDSGAGPAGGALPMVFAAANESMLCGEMGQLNLNQKQVEGGAGAVGQDQRELPSARLGSITETQDGAAANGNGMNNHGSGNVGAEGEDGDISM